jgi:hypothetical protein
MIFDVVYPSGERAYAIGYPGTTLVVDIVPPGPESCLRDVLEVEPIPGAPSGTDVRVVRIVGGPRRPTLRVRVPGGELARENWMNVRDAEGWSTVDGHDVDPDVVWVVADRDGLDPSTLGDVLPR